MRFITIVLFALLLNFSAYADMGDRLNSGFGINLNHNSKDSLPVLSNSILGTAQVLTGTTLGVIGSGITTFHTVGYTGNSTTQTPDYPSLTFPVAGTLRNFRAQAQTITTGSRTITLNKNGSATTLTCVLSSGNNPCTPAGSPSVTVAAGDYVDIQATPTSSPPNSVLMFAVDFISATGNNTIIPGGSLGYSTSVTTVSQPFTQQFGTTVSAGQTAFLPEGGTISRLYVTEVTPPGGVAQYNFGVNKNGVAAGTPAVMSAIVSGSATTANDTVNSISVSAGDNLSFSAIPTGTPAASVTGSGLAFTPTTPGDFVFLVTQATTGDSSTATTFFSLTGAMSATEANAQSLVNNMTVTKMVINLDQSAPGTGKSRAFTLNQNGSATALTCTISNTATTCTATGSISVADGDLLDVADVPTGTPASGRLSISTIAHR